MNATGSVPNRDRLAKLLREAGSALDPDGVAELIAAGLAMLREQLAARGLDGFVVPRSDEHQGEYVPLCAQRLAWLTGFTGSAGIAIVLKDRAALFVDGRYTLQAAAQVDPALFEIRHVTDEPPAQWLGSVLGKG